MRTQQWLRAHLGRGFPPPHTFFCLRFESIFGETLGMRGQAGDSSGRALILRRERPRQGSLAVYQTWNFGDQPCLLLLVTMG